MKNQGYMLLAWVLGNFIAYTLSGIAVGYWLTEIQGAPKWVFYLFGLAGFVLAVVQLIRLASNKHKND